MLYRFYHQDTEIDDKLDTCIVSGILRTHGMRRIYLIQKGNPSLSTVILGYCNIEDIDRLMNNEPPRIHSSPPVRINEGSFYNVRHLLHDAHITFKEKLCYTIMLSGDVYNILFFVAQGSTYVAQTNRMNHSLFDLVCLGDYAKWRDTLRVARKLTNLGFKDNSDEEKSEDTSFDSYPIRTTISDTSTRYIYGTDSSTQSSTNGYFR